MNQVMAIGRVPWTEEALRDALQEFDAIYRERPIQDNAGGMKAPHMFAVWFMARALAPATIIESGVWRGQGTWLFEQACPDAEIIAIDINLARRQYISPRAEYLDTDFASQDWTHLDPDRTLVFFDDHQDAYRRLQQCAWLGFRHLIFEDNYPPSQGDCYSLKKAFAGAGFDPASVVGKNPSEALAQRLRRLLVKFRRSLRATLSPQQLPQRIPPNLHHAERLKARLESYYEFPPIYHSERTRWGDLWDQELYPTPAPLLSQDQAELFPEFYREAPFYTWICYAQLRA